MLHKTALVLVIGIMLVGLPLVSFAQGDNAPTTPAAGSSFVAAPPMVTPNPCVMGAVRVLQPYRIQMLTERLKLTEDQKAKFSDCIAKSEEALRPLIQAQRKASEEFVLDLTKPGLQESELQVAANAAIKAEGAILREKVRALVEVRALLTPEQLKEFNTIIEQTTVTWRPRPSGFGVMKDRPAPTPTNQSDAPAATGTN